MQVQMNSEVESAGSHGEKGSGMLPDAHRVISK